MTNTSVSAPGQIKAVIYAAKSTADPRGSIGTQHADCRSLAEADGYAIVASYEDEAASAFTGDRGPGLEFALTHAERLAKDDGQAVLIVQHSDRLARGDGKIAKHVVEYALWAIKREITIRSVEDDETFRDLLYAVVTGQRNNEDSRRKGQATAAGKRRAAERGEFVGGIRPDGYRIIRDVNDKGIVERRMEFDPARAEIYHLTWQLAKTGHGVNSIVAELNQRGFVTAPYKHGHKPGPFDGSRVRQTLDNAVYAGLAVHKGEIVATGTWPPYVAPADFHRLKAERMQRSHADKRTGGRPPEGYVLSRVARCGLCRGPLDTLTDRNYRQDGSRARRYVCRTHRERPDGCSAKPIDATLVDRAFVAHLTNFLGDVKGWHESLMASHSAERGRLGIEVQRAEQEIAKLANRLDKYQGLLDSALDEGDDPMTTMLRQQIVRNQGELELAERRLTATHDALEATDAVPGYDGLLDFFAALRAALSERTQQAADDIKRLNLVVRDYFGAVKLSSQPEGILIQPYLSPAAVARIVADWPNPPLTLHHAVYDPEPVTASAIPPLLPVQARANPAPPSRTAVSSWTPESWWFAPFIAVSER
jgi:DNA invertase Pin-like site-specific DNA recombinase